MGGQITRNSFYDTLNGPATSHRCHHKPKRCLPVQPCGGLSSVPLLFHPSTKGSQIVMDMSQRTVKRQASFCNAITFSNRPIAVYEQVRLKITKKQCCWSGALRLGFTCKDPSRINPDTLPKYACPDLVSQSGFWAKALPEELSNEGTVIAFWVDKKGRVFYRINNSSPMLFFSGVHVSEPLWALIDIYGLTRGVQLLGSSLHPDLRGLSLPSSPSFTPNTPTVLCGGKSEPNLNIPLNASLNSSLNSNYHSTFSSSTGTTPSSPFSSHPESPTFPSCSTSWSDECTICYENVVDTVLYACGHMCLCYTCGLKLKKMANACCPICRRTIKDIIKIYRST
ncbi:hypothetical protein fugu_012348 [Takifugu bimaculatus]|uniref:RING-type E3 ubiquitin transferase n=1 Tax=Takifugu bimaculatus TaxID=433685 RepID=A0A4Z2C542_9TELE|nr:hypothetical protein fugu_012348 [Takifugu bimaculatus]